MRNTFFLISLLLVSYSASAQWRPNPFYFNFKGVKADSVLIIPRDTTYANTGSEPDSARLAYKKMSLWLRTPERWLEMQHRIEAINGVVNTIVPDGAGYYFMKFNSPLLINKRIISIVMESYPFHPVDTPEDIYNGPFAVFGSSYFFDPTSGDILFTYQFDITGPPYGVRMRIIYTNQ